jgi:hypothetical protein
MVEITLKFKDTADCKNIKSLRFGFSRIIKEKIRNQETYYEKLIAHLIALNKRLGVLLLYYLYTN